MSRESLDVAGYMTFSFHTVSNITSARDQVFYSFSGFILAIFDLVSQGEYHLVNANQSLMCCVSHGGGMTVDVW